LRRTTLAVAVGVNLVVFTVVNALWLNTIDLVFERAAEIVPHIEKHLAA